MKTIITFSTFLACATLFAQEAKPAVAIGAARARKYDWTTRAAMGDVVKRDRLAFYNPGQHC
jgi:hypothetical protein